MTLTEAAACGTPAVATDIAGHDDAVLDGESGLLVDDLGHADALARVWATTCCAPASGAARPGRAGSRGGRRRGVPLRRWPRKRWAEPPAGGSGGGRPVHLEAIELTAGTRHDLGQIE